MQAKEAVTDPLAHWGTSERFTLVRDRGQFERRTRSALEASRSSNFYGFSWGSPVGGCRGLERDETRALLAGIVGHPCARSSPCLPVGSPFIWSGSVSEHPLPKPLPSAVTFPL